MAKWLLSGASKALLEVCKLELFLYLANWRASEASETLSGLNNGNQRYIFIYTGKEVITSM